MQNYRLWRPILNRANKEISFEEIISNKRTESYEGTI